jgi:hypothetical protein
MDIVVRRTGGVTGMTRTWRANSAEVDGSADWDAVVGQLRETVVPDPKPQVRDDFVWTITVDTTTVTVPGSALQEPLAGLVRKVCDPAVRG